MPLAAPAAAAPTTAVLPSPVLVSRAVTAPPPRASAEAATPMLSEGARCGETERSARGGGAAAYAAAGDAPSARATRSSGVYPAAATALGPQRAERVPSECPGSARRPSTSAVSGGGPM